MSGVHLEQDLRALLAYGRTPPHLLPGVVHEITHHWCFLSPVGFVLSYLQLRARRSAILLEAGRGDANVLFRRLLGDVVRYETAIALLRPLAEGLAMFAEFDAVSGEKSAAWSVPTEFIGWLFSGGLEGIRFGGIHFPYEGTRRPLMQWRRTEQCLRRKEAILGHPFDVDDGGYLPGYLAVRQLWFDVARADKRLLNESDLFLMFARSFFYDDYGLVALLLDDAPTDLAVSERIILHIAGRVDALREVTGEQVNSFEQAVLAGELTGERFIEALATDKAAAQRGRAAATKMIAEVENASDHTGDDVLASFDADVLAQRDILNLGQLDVVVDVDEAGQCRVMHGQTTIHGGPALPGITLGSGTGVVSMFCSTLTGTKGRAVAVYRGDERVALFFGGPDERNQDLRNLFLHVTDPRSLQQTTEKMGAMLENVLTWNGLISLVQEMREMLPEVCAKVYEAAALRNVRSAQRPNAVATMKQDGLLPVLGWDRARITGLVLLSLSWPLRRKRPEMSQLFSDYGLNLDETLRAMRTCEEQYGIPQVWDAGDIILCSV